VRSQVHVTGPSVTVGLQGGRQATCRGKVGVNVWIVTKAPSAVAGDDAGSTRGPTQDTRATHRQRGGGWQCGPAHHGPTLQGQQGIWWPTELAHVAYTHSDGDTTASAVGARCGNTTMARHALGQHGCGDLAAQPMAQLQPSMATLRPHCHMREG